MTRPHPHASYREHVSSEAEAVEETVNDNYEYTDEDMAAVGRAFMAAIEQNRDHAYIKHWSPAQCPSEIIVDLINHHYDDTTDLRAQLATARKALEEMAKWVDLPDQLPIQDRMSGEEHMYAEGINYGLQKAGRYARAALNSGEQKQIEDWPYPEGNPTCAQDLK